MVIKINLASGKDDSPSTSLVGFLLPLILGVAAGALILFSWQINLNRQLLSLDYNYAQSVKKIAEVSKQNNIEPHNLAKIKQISLIAKNHSDLINIFNNLQKNLSDNISVTKLFFNNLTVVIMGRVRSIAMLKQSLDSIDKQRIGLQKILKKDDYYEFELLWRYK